MTHGHVVQWFTVVNSHTQAWINVTIVPSTPVTTNGCLNDIFHAAKQIDVSLLIVLTWEMAAAGSAIVISENL